jgi:hypothetical protein
LGSQNDAVPEGGLKDEALNEACPDGVQTAIKLQQRLLEQLDHVSKLMLGKASLTVDDFTNLLQAMKMEFEKPVIERLMSWERRLHLLDDFLASGSGTHKSKEENS